MDKGVFPLLVVIMGLFMINIKKTNSPLYKRGIVVVGSAPTLYISKFILSDMFLRGLKNIFIKKQRQCFYAG